MDTEKKYTGIEIIKKKIEERDDFSKIPSVKIVMFICKYGIEVIQSLADAGVDFEKLPGW